MVTEKTAFDLDIGQLGITSSEPGFGYLSAFEGLGFLINYDSVTPQPNLRRIPFSPFLAFLTVIVPMTNPQCYKDFDVAFL